MQPLYFETHGTGQALLILHGLFGSSDNWHSVSLRLSTHFQVFALDQRNHGRSPRALEMGYGLMADDLRDFMGAQGLSRAHVLGHSMGGKTAMQFALSHPAMTRSLIVADIAPRACIPRHHKILEALLSLDPAAFQTRKEIEGVLARDIPDLSTRQFLLKNVRRAPGGGFYWRIGLEEINRNYPRLSEAVGGAHPFEGPALFLRGERSDYLMESDLPAIHRLFPAAQMIAVPGAGHLLHAENPSFFVEKVTRFILDRVPA
jgi:esterase